MKFDAGSYTNVPLTPDRETTLCRADRSAQGQCLCPAARAAAGRDGVVLNIDEAAVALTARGDDLADLCASAARVRDAVRSRPDGAVEGAAVDHHSRKAFIPVTHPCRDNCH